MEVRKWTAVTYVCPPSHARQDLSCASDCLPDLRVCSRVLSLVAWGMTTPTVRTELMAKLSEARGGYTLGEGLIETVLNYLVDVAKMKNVKEFKIEALSSIAHEAWADENDGMSLPGFHASAVKDWVAGKHLPAVQQAPRSIDGDDVEEDVEDSRPWKRPRRSTHARHWTLSSRTCRPR